MKLLMTLVMFITIAFRETYGYGRMIDPLSRSSLWRKNFPSKVNQDDAHLNCGGPIVQFDKNNGKCGECGDDYSLPRPRPNENGGTYGKGMIGRVYRKGSIINVNVELLGSHHGQFYFDICPMYMVKIETFECFYRHPLLLADGSGYTYNVTKTEKQLRNVVVKLKLPLRLDCDHCVLRWQFFADDNYFEESGMIMSHPYKATWRNCADVAIIKSRSTQFLRKGINSRSNPPNYVGGTGLSGTVQLYKVSQGNFTLNFASEFKLHFRHKRRHRKKGRMAFAKVLVLALVAAINLQGIYGHGRLMDPINRSSVWRDARFKHLNLPKNYNDNENFCGGVGIHHGKNGGKCGLCGDDWSRPQPRANENGGLYGNGVIVSEYKKGQTITVYVHLSANHLGTFNFNACPLKSPTDLETDECFEQYPLPLADGSGYLRKVPGGVREFKIDLKLPSNLSSKHTVIRWNYRTGNTWGICPDGKGAMGCGPQETFRSCSDVSIL
ncbi:uncharacterized protein LOC116840526 [Odontomachus brunneus]|uniref:uncharacterized protein LOC116840526 n=1 Tax=Odontomachus brunneus TaxID=486640 RepID=UPI0013F20551|nr:uncharacterized protein LOC116840526 [Odontomachus brunneus]